MLEPIDEDIRNQQAVLLLGHDFLPNAYTLLHEYLQQNFEEHQEVPLRLSKSISIQNHMKTTSRVIHFSNIPS